MRKQLSSQTTSVRAVVGKEVGLHLLQVAGDDPAMVDMLRAMLWDEYGRADFPFGISEEGMMIWWAHQQGTTRQ